MLFFIFVCLERQHVYDTNPPLIEGPPEAAESIFSLGPCSFGRVWVETNYHTLLMFMAPVEEMHIATGVSPWTGNISRKKVRGYLMLVAFNLEQI